MLDAPGPWGTGPFILSQGYSSIDNLCAIIQAEPLACTWLKTKDNQTPYVVLDANHSYRNKDRGPRLERVIFRNDLSREDALRLCLSTEGQVDIVTEVSPDDADRVVSSHDANLVNVKSNITLAGIFNRLAKDNPFDDRRIRDALNLSINRQALISQGFKGYADVIPSLTPPWALDFPDGLQPKPYDPKQARDLLREGGGWPQERVLCLAAPKKYLKVAQQISHDLNATLAIQVKVTVIPEELQTDWMRVLAEKKLVPNWDILLWDAFAFFSEDTPAYVHREFLGADGALRASPKLKSFDQIYREFSRQTDKVKRHKIAAQIDKYVYDEALALFLCAPRSLYAVNKHVTFRPYRTTFELADTEVKNGHWSLKC